MIFGRRRYLVGVAAWSLPLPLPTLLPCYLPTYGASCYAAYALPAPALWFGERRACSATVAGGTSRRCDAALVIAPGAVRVLMP